MNTYTVWVRLNQYQTAHIQMTARDYFTAKALAEAQYGSGSVLNITENSQS
jgi:hypothetical protein